MVQLPEDVGHEQTLPRGKRISCNKIWELSVHSRGRGPGKGPGKELIDRMALEKCVK